jgi:hypothetical protein
VSLGHTVPDGAWVLGDQRAEPLLAGAQRLDFALAVGVSAGRAAHRLPTTPM